jgi:hypothetical protein
MRFRFVGEHTGGGSSITMNGITFEGKEPSDVPDDLVFRFRNSVEFRGVPGRKKAEDE